MTKTNGPTQHELEFVSIHYINGVFEIYGDNLGNDKLSVLILDPVDARFVANTILAKVGPPEEIETRRTIAAYYAALKAKLKRNWVKLFPTHEFNAAVI